MFLRARLFFSLATLVVGCGGAVADNSSAPGTSPSDAPSGAARDGGTATSTGTTVTGTTGPAQPALGALCGTRGAPASCGPKRFCKFPMNKSGFGACGHDDSGGTCAEMPTSCVENYAPVCGCDGKTYSNDCDAYAAGISIAHINACGSFRCGMAWCDAASEYCDVPAPQSFNPTPTCLVLPTHCASTGGKIPTCGTCFPPTPCPLGGNCDVTSCAVEQVAGLPAFTLTHKN